MYFDGFGKGENNQHIPAALTENTSIKWQVHDSIQLVVFFRLLESAYGKQLNK